MLDAAALSTGLGLLRSSWTSAVQRPQQLKDRSKLEAASAARPV